MAMRMVQRPGGYAQKQDHSTIAFETVLWYHMMLAMRMPGFMAMRIVLMSY